MWDIGGQESLRSAWNTYYTNTEVSLTIRDTYGNIELFETVSLPFTVPKCVFFAAHYLIIFIHIFSHCNLFLFFLSVFNCSCR